jgi:hypothetical protein
MRDQFRAFLDGLSTRGWKAVEEDAMTEPRPERCCCGGLYAEHGGAGSLYCPTGQRALCEECISEGGRICPTHKVPLGW